MAGGFGDLTVIVAKRRRSFDFNLISFEEKTHKARLYVMYRQNISKFCLKDIGKSFRKNGQTGENVSTPKS